jgi:hypothetical protein
MEWWRFSLFDFNETQSQQGDERETGMAITVN